MTVRQPVVSQGTRYGTLLVLVSTAHLRSRIHDYLLNLALLGLGALVAAGALALMLERMVSRPLLKLADVARRIAATEDYSVRATGAGGDEIGLLAGAFNRMLTEIDGRQKQAQQAIRVRDDFLSIASHELKTPLTSLKLQVQGLLMMPPSSLDAADAARLKQTLEVVERQVARLDKLIGNLLDVSRIAAGRLVHRSRRDRPVDAGAGGDAPVRAAARRAATAGSTRASKRTVIGVWDAPRIDQVVTNLLVQRHQVRRRQADRAEGREHGRGRAPHRARPRHRHLAPTISAASSDASSAPPRSATAASGSGLFISSQIVRAHGGTIRVESEPEAGSTFTVDLPRGSAKPGAST